MIEGGILFKIGDFSRLAKISVRMLRYYDDDIIGLYQWSPKNKGFRWYSPIFYLEKGIYR